MFSFWLSVSHNSLLWNHFGSVSERCGRRGSEHSNLAERTSRPSQMTGTVYNPESLSLSLLRAHQARVDRLKRWPVRLVYWALGFFSPPHIPVFSACLWPLVAHQAWMKRSSLQLSSQTAMIVLQGRQKIASDFWSGVLIMRLRGEHAWEVTGCTSEYVFPTRRLWGHIEMQMLLHFKT